MQDGYTLLEVMLTIAIVTTMVACGFPSLRFLMEKIHTHLLQEEVSEVINQTRQMALQRHLPLSACKSKDLKTCDGQWRDGVLIFVDEADDGMIHQSDQIVKAKIFVSTAGSLMWRGFPQHQDYLHFTAQGLLTNNNGSFHYVSSEYPSLNWTLLINKAGRVRAQ